MITPDKTEKTVFWGSTAESVASSLETDLKKGVSEKEAELRIRSFGPNVIEAPRGRGRLALLLEQLKSPLILILVAAGAITAAISHYRDAVFIFIAVAVNSALGYWQESKAERAIAALGAYLRERVRVVRSGKEREIDVDALVPGDIVRLSQGDRIPADCRVAYANDFQVDESVLTGESLPVAKSADPVQADARVADRVSMVFAGTLATQGVATAIVCATGPRTEFGKIAADIAASEKEKTPMQKAIARFSAYLSALLGALTAAVFAVGIISGRPVAEMFLTSVAIAVSAIPEGLPISMTVILAIGVERMAKRKAVVRKLVAAEALGSTTLILTDKTGTLTMAKMALSSVRAFGIDERKALELALINADVSIENPDDPASQWRLDGRIMEMALVREAGMRGFTPGEIGDKSKVLQTTPFNSSDKFSSSLVEENGRGLAVLFGAPEKLLLRSTLDAPEREKLEQQISELALSGERVLGLATKEMKKGESLPSEAVGPQGLKFAALLCFRDPVRPGIKEAVERVRRAGVKTVILTGDHSGTAIAVANEVGIMADARSALDASRLGDMTDEELIAILPSITVISRVSPLEKSRIVKLYRKMGEIVAMTGDGVNDSPSIKEADVGIAMGSGTEVARSVADLVLLDDNYETIAAAIEEGRRILSNIRKVLIYLLSTVADELMLIGGAILFSVPLPISALQILWVNFFSDSFPAVAFAYEREAGRTISGASKKLVLFDPFTKFLIVIIGISTSALLFASYLVLLKIGFDEVLVKTFVFAAFGTYTLFAALSLRRLDRPIWTYSPFSNRHLAAGVGGGLLLMGAAVYAPALQSLFGTVPLPPAWAVGVLSIGALNIALIELAKRFRGKT